MFSVRDRAIAPWKPHLERAVKSLPQAHVEAQSAGLGHLHQAVVAAAEEADLPTEPIGVHQNQVVIGHTPEGDQLADHEFGTPRQGPTPVLRNAHRSALPEAQGIYAATLARLTGLR